MPPPDAIASAYDIDPGEKSLRQRRAPVTREVSGFTQSMFDYRGQYRLHIFGYDVTAVLDKCPTARTTEQCQRPTGGQSVGKLRGLTGVLNEPLNIVKECLGYLDLVTRMLQVPKILCIQRGLTRVSTARLSSPFSKALSASASG